MVRVLHAGYVEMDISEHPKVPKVFLYFANAVQSLMFSNHWIISSHIPKLYVLYIENFAATVWMSQIWHDNPMSHTLF